MRQLKKNNHLSPHHIVIKHMLLWDRFVVVLFYWSKSFTSEI